jgi:hypothetical protein
LELGTSSNSPKIKSNSNPGVPVISLRTKLVASLSLYTSDNDPESIEPVVAAKDDGFHQSVCGEDGDDETEEDILDDTEELFELDIDTEEETELLILLLIDELTLCDIELEIDWELLILELID